MARPKPVKGGVRTTIWIPEKHLKLWKEIENKSGFVSLALDDAIGIMAWAILKKENPEKYKRPIDDKPIDEILPEFNEQFPMEPLTAKRKGIEQKWPKNSPSKQELW